MKREFRSNGVYDLFIYSAFIYSHFKQKHGEAYSNGRKIPMQRNFTETQGAIQLHARMQIAQQIHDTDSKTAKWITSDKLQELTSQAIQRRLRN